MNITERLVRRAKRRLGLTSASRAVAVVRPLYDLLLETLYGRRGLPRVVSEGETIRVLPAHRYVAEGYEAAVLRALRENLRPGAAAFDVGAHVGVITVLLARWVGAAGRVCAFEPAPETRRALLAHLELNGVADRVRVVASAISDATGTAQLYMVGSSPENTLSPGHHRLPTARAIPVAVTTVDAFCEGEGIVPNLIKIDIEGFELHALRGAAATLKRHRPLVVVEVHPMNWPELGIDPQDAARLLADLGYRAVGLEEQVDPLADYGHVVLKAV